MMSNEEKETISQKVDQSGEQDIGEIELTSENSTTSSDTINDATIEFTEKEEPKGDDFEWKGVKFPGWAQGPHFIVLNGSFVLAIDPNCVTMEMKSNWVGKYVPILVQLGRKVLEKLLNEEIRTI